ncbi:MAG: DUF58 domain-containing protein [Nocardioidaceae bacterium]|nr:DUF58 domain-containing protein [Nocardioidaceae bacterium]NUS52868.1 DUF58 domain-containing protein [Nocardioidaceae bacterium]
MREALSAMTIRGRAFLAAGVTALLCAMFLGHDELVRVGALLVLLPLATAWFLGRSRYRLGLVRSLTPSQVVAGQQARVTLDLTNDGRMPTGLLLLEDQIPYVLGTRPRFVVDKMGPKWKRSVGYLVRSDVRGKFDVGPMKVRLSDPFGLVELERTFQSRSSLVVTPRVVPLPAIPLSGAWTGSGDNRPRAFASGSAEDVTVREYRRGDDLRRVHWRSSAHAGELMVRREEQPWQSRATLFVDNRRYAHRGTGAASSLEHAVTAAASIAVHLVQRGFTVRLVTALGEESGAASWHEHGAATAEAAPLLESLAVLTDTAHPHIDARWLQEAGHAGLLIAVLGDVADHDRPVLTRLRHSAANAMALTLDVPAWTRGNEAGPSTVAATTAWLGANGWRSVTSGPADPLPTVWQELGVAGRSGAPRGSDPRRTPEVAS